eukprot:10875938-Alexandrium_andersonii.AAC.1
MLAKTAMAPGAGPLSTRIGPRFLQLAPTEQIPERPTCPPRGRRANAVEHAGQRPGLASESW